MNWGLLSFTLLLFAVGIGNLYSASGIRLEEEIGRASCRERV